MIGLTVITLSGFHCISKIDHQKMLPTVFFNNNEEKRSPEVDKKSFENFFFHSLQKFLSIFGVLNMLRGFFIFWVFIWKRSVWTMITKQYPSFTKAVKFFTNCSFENNATVKEDSSEEPATTRTLLASSRSNQRLMTNETVC